MHKLKNLPLGHSNSTQKGQLDNMGDGSLKHTWVLAHIFSCLQKETVSDAKPDSAKGKGRKRASGTPKAKKSGMVWFLCKNVLTCLQRTPRAVLFLFVVMFCGLIDIWGLCIYKELEIGSLHFSEASTHLFKVLCFFWYHIKCCNFEMFAITPVCLWRACVSGSVTPEVLF